MCKTDAIFPIYSSDILVSPQKGDIPAASVPLGLCWLHDTEWEGSNDETGKVDKDQIIQKLVIRRSLYYTLKAMGNCWKDLRGNNYEAVFCKSGKSW